MKSRASKPQFGLKLQRSHGFKLNKMTVLQWLLHLVRPWPPLGHLSLLSKMVSCCTISSYFFLCSSNSAFHSSPKLPYLSLNLGSLFLLSSQLSRHAPYLTFPFPGHLHHIRFGPLIHISDLRLELNPLLPLYPYLPLRLLNRIRPFPSYSPKTKFYLLATPTVQRPTQKKQSLELYRKRNSDPAPFCRYRGDRATALIFQTRTGCLLAQSRRCELYRDDPTCPLCGEEEETIDLVVSQCQRLEHTGKNASSCSLEPALGLADADDDGARRETEDTERHLVVWEILCRDMETLNSRGLQKWTFIK
ncbi:hypothetical protein ISCGN_026077 [Ixodes scapularis]